jgi:type I restriction enzyme S subunit
MKSNWQFTRLGEVIDIHDSRRVPLSGVQRSQRQGKYPYYGAQGIIDHIDDFIFEGRYLLIAEDGENLRSRKQPIALFADGKFWVNNHAHIITAKPDHADDRFIASWLNQANLAAYVTGAAQPKLSQGNLKQIELPLPDLPTQKKIAGILSAYDDLIENNLRRIAILEEMAQSLYREWFVHFRFPGHETVQLVDSELGEIPEGWEVKKLGGIYKTSSGGTPSRKKPEYYTSGNIRWVKTKELNDGFILNTEELITEEALKKSSAKLFPSGTVLIALYGATIGKLGILSQDASTNQACCAFLQQSDQHGRAFAFLTLKHRREDIISLRQGAAQQNISQAVLREFEVIVPQADLLHQFNQVAEPMLDGILNLQRRNQNLRKTRDLLLPKLLSQ